MVAVTNSNSPDPAARSVVNDRAESVAPEPRPHAPKRLVDVRHSPFAAEYPFASNHLNVGSAADPLWMHYLDEGDKDAPVVVMVHGNPTWSFYYRKLVTALRGKYRCIVPDHIGCGLSDRPQAWGYRLGQHIDNVQRLLDHCGVQRFSLIVHDWGGAIGMGVATERPDDVVCSTVTNTAAFLSKDIPLSIASCRIPGFGPIAVRGFNGFAFAATFRAVYKSLDATAKAGLLAPYGNWHDRIATLRFVEDIPLDPAHPSYARLKRIEDRLPLLRDKPMQLVWGDDDFCFTPTFRKRWSEFFPDAAVHAFADVGHYVNEDAPERIVPLTTRFLEQHVVEQHVVGAPIGQR